MKNHTGTHLLQAALIEVLGNTVKQSGSLVHPDYLRFDFTYHENLSPEDITRVENVVNAKIMEDIPVNVVNTTMKDALDQGALAFFGDKYNPEKVRMIKVDDFSVELCGGTHVPSTGVIGAFKIVDVTALSAGHRRIFAVTGPKAIELFQESFAAIKALSQEFKVKREEVVSVIAKQHEQLKTLQHEIRKLKKESWRTKLAEWQSNASMIGSLPFLFLHLHDMEHDDMKEIISSLSSSKPGLYFVASETDGKISFLASLSPAYKNAINLKNFGTWLKDEHGLRGGGSPVMIQGGGEKFDANLESAIRGWIEKNQE
jgi:alanyl-tRNA synthetase